MNTLHVLVTQFQQLWPLVKGLNQASIYYLMILSVPTLAKDHDDISGPYMSLSPQICP